MSIMGYSSWDDAGSQFGSSKGSKPMTVSGEPTSPTPTTTPPTGTTPPVSGNPLPPTTTPTQPAPTGAMDPYQQYLQYQQRTNAADDSGNRAAPVDQATWAAMTPQDRNALMGGGWQPAPDNVRQQFISQFGANPVPYKPGDSTGQSIAGMNGVDGSQGEYVTGFGEPMLYGRPISEWAIDPSRVLKNPDGSWVIESTNIKGDWLAQQQNQDAHSGMDLDWIKGVGFVLGGAALGGAFSGAEGLGAAGSEGFDGGLALDGAGGGAGAGLDAGGAAGGITDGLNLDLLPPIDATTIPEVTDSFIPAINDAIDSSLLPPIPETTIPDFGPPPVIEGGAGGSAFPSVDDPLNIGSPTLTDPNVPTIPPPDVGGSGAPSIWDRMMANPVGTAAGGASIINTLIGNRANRDPNAGVPDALRNNTTTQDNKPIIDQARQTILNNGQATPEQKHSIDAQIDQHKKEAREALLQKAINSGMGANSQVTQQQLDKMDLEAENLRGQMYMQQAQQNIGNALKEWGEANAQDLGIQQIIANYQMKNSQESQQLTQSISQTLAMIYGMSNSRGGF